MEQKINYQKILDKTIEKIKSERITPALLLHSCCAPCSSYVLEYLSEYFSITVLYYNPNISPVEEYNYRKSEQIRLISEMNFKNPVKIMDCDWDNQSFNEMAKGMENIPEGGARCQLCYELRLRKTASLAKEHQFDYFTTTLTISPLKNSQVLNRTGEGLADEYGVSYLVSDFKKKEGYKRSIELSGEYNLYRQNYCGCVYSKKSDFP